MPILNLRSSLQDGNVTDPTAAHHRHLCPGKADPKVVGYALEIQVCGHKTE